MKKINGGIYASHIKRVLDFSLSLSALIVLSPLMVVLTVVGAIAMKGNPFFIQERTGKIDPASGKEVIFKLIKFKTMTNGKDEDGNLLPDAERLNKYGSFLRASSLDELGELINILKGDMAIVGPRPLLVRYLDRYNERQRHRHDVRPGLTGYAQVHGRNSISWEEKFDWDVKYVGDVSFSVDVKIVLDTLKTVLKREGISADGEATMAEFVGSEAK